MASYDDTNVLKNKLDWSKSFNRSFALPLDRSSMFASKADADAYARGDGSDSRSLGKTSYVGQLITVFENDVVTVYKINADRTLAPLATGGDAEDIRGKLMQLSSYLLSSEGVVDQLSGAIDTLRVNLSNEITALSDALSDAIDTKLDTETFIQISNYTGLSAAYPGNEVVTKNDIKGLSGAMVLVGKVDKEGAPLLSTGSNVQLSDLFNVIPLGRTTSAPYVGDVVIQTQPSPKPGETVDKEFVWTAQNGGQWNELGSEGIYATKVELEVEAQARQDNDTYLSGRIGDLSSSLSNAISAKIWIKDGASAGYENGKYSDLSIIKISEEDYMTQVADGTLISAGVLYIISSDNVNAYGQRVINVAEPEESSDAATKNYVDSKNSDADAKIEALSSKLSSEVINLSTALSNEIDSLSSRLSGDIGTLSADLSGEIENLSASLSGEIDNLSTALSGQIETLSTNLSTDLCAETIRAKGVEQTLSNEISTKIWIKDPNSEGFENGKYTDLSVIKVTEDEYMAKVADGTLLKDGILYVISSDHINAYGQKIVNVATPTDPGDATNKEYVDTEVKKVADSALSAIELNGLEFDISNNKATLFIGAINCGTATSLAD